MPNTERFRRQLDEGDALRSQIKQDVIRAEKLTRQKERAEFWEGVKQLTPRQVVDGFKEGIKETVEETTWWKTKKKNQEVFQLDSQLPVRQYLEVLRDKIMPMRQIKRYGPKDGKIAYGLVYGVRAQFEPTGKSHTKKERIETVISGRGFSSTVMMNKEKEVANVGLRMVHNVLGVVLDNSGFLKLSKQRCAKAPGFEKSKNPLKWRAGRGEVGVGKLNFVISMTSPDGFQQFEQALTDFYVGLKAGEGK